MRYWTEALFERLAALEHEEQREDVLGRFQAIVAREWAPAGREPLRRLLPDSRYSCVAPFWI